MSELCSRLHVLFNGLRTYGFPFDATQLPLNGIYILFEKVERAHGANRIVRVGTHTGDNQLGSRLKQHFVVENKDRSIFRKNIGRALLNRDGDSFLEQWELDLTTRAAKDKYKSTVPNERLKEIERRVSEHIQRNFRFVVFAVTDKATRLDWESKVISTVSLCQECCSSDQWLGRSSPKKKIRESGLWLVNELYKQPLLVAEFQALEKTINL